tara:strand:+ start:111 stop:1148 length:1038 start_codon:yes stop_codon:yes gene_type:complete
VSHGGYHGTIKMGGKVIQEGYQKPDGSYGIRGGIDDRSRLDKNPSRDRYQNINQRVKDQTKGIKSILNMPKDDFGGSRDNYIAAQSGINNLSNLLRAQQEKTLRDSITSSFGKGVVNKDDFLGHAGDKMFLGMNYGSTPTVAASVINPFSGKTIETIKAREGLTDPQYREYIESLGNINPDLAYETFMPTPIKFLNKAMEVAAPFPLKILASTMEGGKDIADYFSNKVKSTGTDISDQLRRYQEGIRGLLGNQTTQTDPSREFISRMNPNVAPQGEDFTIPIDFQKETLPVNKNVDGGNYEMTNVPFDYFTNRRKGQFLNFNEGGLASLNNPDYNKLMGASNFGF